MTRRLTFIALAAALTAAGVAPAASGGSPPALGAPGAAAALGIPFGRIAALGATADLHHGLPGFGQRGQNPSQIEPLPEIPPHLQFVPIQVAERMLDLASVTRRDVVYDLGCGDGRVAILAARKYGATSVGVDVDPKRIAEANVNAEKAGVSSLVRFVQQPTIDVSEATVLVMSIPQSSAWLTQNGLLHPALTRQLRAGSRIVTNFVSGSMKDWRPERVDHFPDARGNARAIIYMWKL